MTTGRHKQWFSRGIEENLDALFGVALRLTGHRADAEDLVADCISRAWQARDTLQDKRCLRAWLFRILRNQHITQCRKSARRPPETTYDEGVGEFLEQQNDDFLNWWANPELSCFGAGLAEQIDRALSGIPRPYREAIQLVNVEGLSYEEAATVLGIASGTIRSRMKRGRTLLQKALWRQARDAGLASAKHPMSASAGG